MSSSIKSPNDGLHPEQHSTSSANRSTLVSSTHQRTKLPTQTTSLDNLLAPFNSVPSNSHSQSIPSNTSNQSQLPASRTHSIQPPTTTDISSQLEPTAGPGSNLPSSHHPPSKLVPPTRIPSLFNPITRNLLQTSKNQSVLNAWQYLPFLTKQATNIASSFFSHHLNGPPKKSWGIEMTIFTAIVRDMANFTHLSSIHQLRSLMDLGQILPMPKDGIITPVSFKVKRHHLTGFLKELDRSEDGSRVLTGEWVLSKKTWKRMQTESVARRSKNQHTNPSSHLADPSVSESHPDSNHQHGLGHDKVIYFIHGGAYFIMSASTHRPLTISIAKYTECRLFAINYRLAPETKFPGPLHDVIAGYFRLLNDLGIPPENVVLAGDSAGGGLVMALLMYLRDEKYPLPSAAMLFSPWCDLTMSCESWVTNQPYDFLPMPKPDDALNPIRCYLGEDGISKWITHPYVSPLFGDMHGLPPLLIQAGDAEVLRDEVTLLAHKASLHGVKVMHEIYEDCVHVFQVFLFLESSTKALQSMRNFIRHVLPKMGRRQASEVETTYRPRPSSPDTCDDSSIDASDPNQGAVDREISRDAHLIDEMSQTLKQSLPHTPSVPNLDGSVDPDDSCSEEVLSASDEPEDDDAHTLLPDLAEPPGAATLNEQNGSVSETVAALAPSLKRSQSNMSLTRQEVRPSTLSLRGRLPPAMDLETIKNLLLSTPHHEASFDLLDESSLATLQEDLAMKSPQSKLNSSRRASFHAKMIPMHSRNGSIQSNSGSQSPVGSRHNRKQSASQHPLRPSHSRKFTTSNVALLTPMVRSQDNRAPGANVNEDVQAMVQDLISTPSHLKTTVYSQGQEDDPDIEYFKGIHSHTRRGTNNCTSSNAPQLNEHHHLTPSEPATSLETKTSGSISPISSENGLSKLTLQDDKLDDGRSSPEFAFQTPGYGFS